MKIEFQTSRTIVRLLNESDKDLFVNLLIRSRVTEFLNESSISISEFDASQAFKLIITSYRTSTPSRVYGIVSKKNINSILGIVHYKIINFHEAEIFGALFPEFWGKKLAFEVLQNFVEYIFKQSECIKILAYVDCQNRSTKSLLSNANFIDQGEIFSVLFNKPVNLYSISKIF